MPEHTPLLAPYDSGNIVMELEMRRKQVEELRAACKSLVANLPEEVFEWIGDSISWSQVAAIKNAREMARIALAHSQP